MKKFIKIITPIFYGFVIFQFGCKKADPMPHLKDPVYLNILEQIKNAEVEAKSTEKGIKDLEKELEKADPHSIEPKIFRQRISVAKHKNDLAQQKLTYWNSRLTSREKEVKLKYLESYNQNKEFDGSKDLKKYYTREGIEPPKKAEVKSSH